MTDTVRSLSAAWATEADIRAGQSSGAWRERERRAHVIRLPNRHPPVLDSWTAVLPTSCNQ
ncbi:hypothetical protein AB0I68_31470 [Streptomyces sp. NPDC050448]|uniref:hypothetical protein n=1 Tax=Streptomyces sp. NPDC050448 TaxID=3155404 RepID=UPI003433D74D